IASAAATIRGTITTTTSASPTADRVSALALSRPARTADATASSRPGSSRTCAWPWLTASTTAWSTSQPITRMPLLAYCPASGSPILPRPTTATVVKGSGQLGGADGALKPPRREHQAERQPQVWFLHQAAFELGEHDDRDDQHRGHDDPVAPPAATPDRRTHLPCEEDQEPGEQQASHHALLGQDR